MPSTFIHGILPSASLIPFKKTFSKWTPKQWWLFLFLGAVLGNFPDLDVIPAAFAGSYWRNIHRNWGHNIFSLILLIRLGKFLLEKYVSSDFKDKRGWFFASGLVLSHIFLDSMQDYDPSGVRKGIPLFWPFTDKHYALPFKLFQIWKLPEDKHFLIGHIFSHEFWTHAIFLEIGYGILFWAIWYLIVQFSMSKAPSLIFKRYFRRNISG